MPSFRQLGLDDSGASLTTVGLAQHPVEQSNQAHALVKTFSSPRADIVWGDWQGPSFPNIEEYKFGGRYAYGPGATYRGSKNAYASTKWSVAINERASPLTPAIRFHGTHSHSLLWHSM